MTSVLRTLATQPATAALCSAAQVSIDTWLAVALNDAQDADSRTGHNLRTSQTVAAARIGRSPRTVRRARAVSIRLGVLVEMYRGRELSREERLALVQERPGHQQRGLPNVYAVVVCPPRQRRRISIPRPGRHAIVSSHGEGFVHLPPGGGLGTSTHLVEILPLATAGAVGRKEPAPPALRRKGRPGTSTAYRVMQDPGTGWLFKNVRPGQAAALFAPYEAGGWRGSELARVVVDEIDRQGIEVTLPARSPFGLMKYLLRPFEHNAEAFYRLGLAPAEPAPFVPCGHEDCDGFGNVFVVVDGIDHAVRCPRCHPAQSAG